MEQYGILKNRLRKLLAEKRQLDCMQKRAFKKLRFTQCRKRVSPRILKVQKQINTLREKFWVWVN